MRKANLRKLSELQYYAFKNCLRLHQDSVVLLDAGSMPSAFAISVLALEELGKVLLLDDIVFNTKLNDWDIEDAKARFKQIFEHKIKQWKPHVEAIHGSAQMRRFFGEVYSGKLDLAKQNSIYVGLEKRRLEGKITIPTTTRPKAKRQIRQLNALLIEIVGGGVAGHVGFDGYFVNDLFTRRLLKRLRAVELKVL
jgi:AbiV family abortive infection protein